MLSSDDPGFHPSDLDRLVGRAREHELLREHLAKTIQGTGRLVLIAGEAGIGKTTLVAAVEREAVKRNMLVLQGACYDLTETPPYGPWRELAANSHPGTSTLPLPNVLADGSEAGEMRSQQAVFTQVWDFFAAMAAARPTLGVVEDVHWADPASLDLLPLTSVC